MTDTTNGGAAPGTDGRRQLALNAQYVKDLSFENPRAPQSLLQPPPGVAPDLQVGVDVKAQGLAADVYEVVMLLKVEAKVQNEVIFVAELSYGAVVSLINTTPEDVPIALMVETPRLLFPYARNIISEVTRDGGFTPLLLSPIDFVDIYRRRIAEQQQQGGAPVTA
ncbi:MAG TPA: protein-export chaperone SecB [Stellaceae bacterium]|jgi:preprotein translocase subunit SecB|nr:protein-export chaperone SecB [Stellaceae bacterium]